MLRLLYASFSTLHPSDAESEIRSIVEVSVRKNATRGITGALLYSGKHFAQALEGEEDQVRGLMATIRTDRRHHSVMVTTEDESSSRRFEAWSLAYQGEATYIDRPIEGLFGASSLKARLELSFEIYRIMTAFTQKLPG
jgi:hypothetical protein